MESKIEKIRKGCLRHRRNLAYAIVIFIIWYLAPLILFSTELLTIPNIDFIVTPSTVGDALSLATFAFFVPFGAASLASSYVFHGLYSLLLGPFGLKIGKGPVYFYGLGFFNISFNFVLTFLFVAGFRSFLKYLLKN